MSDGTGLRSRLARLAATGFGDGAGRTIRALDAEGLLRALLLEADTVVMPRELRIEDGDGGGFALEVASRRILTARDLGPGGAPVAMNPEDPAARETLQAMIDRLASKGATARIFHGRLGREIDPAEPGVSVRALAEGWNVTLEAAAPGEAGEALDNFLSEQSEALLAWVMVSDETSESAGEEAYVETLLALAEGDLASRLRETADEGAWRFVALGPVSDDGPHLACAALGEALFLMAVAPGEIANVADRWRRALG